jgi:hypothetical protein
MFDQEIATIVRTGHWPDLIPYVCQNPRCQKTTHAPPGLVAIICGHCGHIDTSTELALQGWRNAVEIQCENKPDKPKKMIPVKDILVMVAGLLATAWAVLS